MLSKSKIKQIRSLELKKFRNELNAFVAEGNKLVADMLHAFECDLLIAKPSWMATQGDIPAKELLEADDDDIRKASFLKNPQDVLAVFKRPTWSLEEADPKPVNPCPRRDTRPRQSRYDHTAGRLVRHRTYYL
jgi:TrmH family RNA methyltransferase